MRTEHDLWAIRCSQLVQGDRLVSYPLVFIHLRYDAGVIVILLQILKKINRQVEWFVYGGSKF